MRRGLLRALHPLRDSRLRETLRSVRPLVAPGSRGSRFAPARAWPRTFEFNSYSQYGRDKPSGEFYATLPFPPSPEWQTLELKLTDLKPLKGAAQIPANWQTLCAVAINGRVKVDGTSAGAGRFDADRKLRNLRWEGGTYPQSILLPGGDASLDPQTYARQFESQIDKSIEQEARDRNKR